VCTNSADSAKDKQKDAPTANKTMDLSSQIDPDEVKAAAAAAIGAAAARAKVSPSSNGCPQARVAS
jgi:hypothetical protein